MKRVNFSDWQEMALKKDIEQIKKKLTSQEPLFTMLGTCIGIRINYY